MWRMHGSPSQDCIRRGEHLRSAVNVGTTPGLPSPPASQVGGGQVRRRLSAPGWGGVLVVVRGRESRPHGEGGQRESAATGLARQEVAGEHRRTVAQARVGPVPGTGVHGHQKVRTYGRGKSALVATRSAQC
jgi:hypothetical protein